MSSEAMETQATDGPKGVDLTENQDGGVIKEILREGDSDAKASTGDKVCVHYVGTLLDGSEFDSSRKRGDKFNFTLGKGEVIKAWDIGVASMRKGELAKLTCSAEYAYGESGSPPKIPPNATLVFEVELFSWQGEDITEAKDGGIIRSILTKGDGYSTPNDYARVTVKFEIKYEDKEVSPVKEVSFTLGESDDPHIVDGAEMAIKKMKEKEKSSFTIQSDYAFGSKGNKELGIPGGATVCYVIEMVSFEKSKPMYEMNTDDKLSQSEIRKSKGTEFYKKGMVEKALKNYLSILDYLDGESTLEREEKEKRDALVLAARLNLALCNMQLHNYNKVIENCNEALLIDKKSTKAYFRRGQAQQNRNDYDLALEDFEAALVADPENKAAKNQIAVCKKKKQDAYQKEKKLYAGMFSKLAQQGSKKTDGSAEERDSVFKDGIGEWDNSMAAGMLPLEQEVAAFGDTFPMAPGNNGINHRR